jgi:hypothetical protein
MNAGNIVNMIVRMVMRRVIGKGIKAGIGAVAKRRGKGARGEDDRQAGQAPQTRKTQGRLKQSMRAVRRIGRF